MKLTFIIAALAVSLMSISSCTTTTEKSTSSFTPSPTATVIVISSPTPDTATAVSVNEVEKPKQLTMCYTFADNIVAVYNTPWGDKTWEVESPTDEQGGRKTAALSFGPGRTHGTDYVYNPDGSWKAITEFYIGKKNLPRIKITYHSRLGVESVTVDGKKILECK